MVASTFRVLLYLELPFEESIKRVDCRFIDPVTEFTYHSEYNPPPADNVQVMNRIKPIETPYLENEE